MTTAFVLSGGANLGAVQVGMLRALDAAGIRPDLLVGASVGAVNAAWYAGAPAGSGVDGLAVIWRSLRRRDVFPMRFGLGFAGFVGQRPSVFDADGLRRLLTTHLRFERLEQSPIPLHVVVTDVLDGIDHAVGTGDAIDAIVASSSIPGVFPPVEIAGRACMDGGVVNNAPISHAVRLGADVIFVLPTGYACALTEPPRTALGMTLHALTLMVNRRLTTDVDHYIGSVDVRVVPPPCPISVGPGDFGQADTLIARAEESTRQWLAASPSMRSVNPLRDHDLRDHHHHDHHEPAGSPPRKRARHVPTPR
jgi:NTE family protein